LISTLEIYLTVKIVKFRPIYSNPRYVILSSFLIGLVFFIFNIPKLVFQGFKIQVNGTEKVICLRGSYNFMKIELLGTTVSSFLMFYLININGNFMKIWWKKLNDLFYSFLSTVLIAILNIMLWFELKRFHAKSVKITLQVNTMKNKLENHRTAKTQLILALLFLIVSVPRSITTALFVIYRSDSILWCFLVLGLEITREIRVKTVF
jgi:hypothetical protein